MTDRLDGDDDAPAPPETRGAADAGETRDAPETSSAPETSHAPEASDALEASDARETNGAVPHRDVTTDPERPVLESAVEYETGWYTGGYDLVEQPDGTTKRYYWADLPPAVVVVAVAEGQVLFVEQYRPTIRETHLELPAGIVEPGESFTTAAARELREETGFAPETTALVQSFWACTGVLRHRRAIVYATGLTPTDRDLDGNEFLTPRTVPVEEALSVARRPPANDATIEGLLLARADGLLDG